MSERRSERTSEALLLVKRGAPLAAIAERLPNLAPRDRRDNGVGEHAAELIVRSGLRALVTHILMDRRPDRLPDELWPPDEVRAAIRAAPRGLNHRAPLRLLRGWLEGCDLASLGEMLGG